MKAIHTNIWARGQFNVCDNIIWYIPYGHNILCAYNIKKGMVENVIALNVEKNHPQGFDSTFCDGKNVIMIPGFEDKLFVYDIENKTIRIIDIPRENLEAEKYSLYCKQDNFLYLLPVFSNKIIKVDLESLEIKPILITVNNGFYDCDCYETSIFLVNNTNKVFVFDMDKECLTVLYEGKEGAIYNTISYNDGKLYLTDEIGRLYSWSIKDSEGTVLNQMGMAFRGSYIINNFLFFLPLHEDHFFMEYNIETNDCKKILLNDTSVYKKWPHSSFSRGVVYESRLYFFSTQYSTIIEYDPFSGKKTETRTLIAKVPDDVLNAVMLNEYKSGLLFREGAGISMSIGNFLEFCISNKT